MPALGEEQSPEPQPSSPLTKLPFPPVTKSHILHCSYHDWHPRYRAITPKARLVPLSQPFLSYLRADGIVLPPDESESQANWSDSDSGVFSSTENPSDSDDEYIDPSQEWDDVQQAIKSAIAELGGKVAPKLNWSAPKDATWISATNSMECRSPNDIYLLLKSSDFITHDLEHAFDDCEDDLDGKSFDDVAQYHLVLRKWILLNPSVEFRCFVRNRKLLGMCQRDLNHFDFLFNMQHKLRDKIQTFFDEKLRESFPEPNFVFDVYIPPPHERVWLVDVNPWAPRTDPLLFSWLELLTMPEPATPQTAETISLPLKIDGQGSVASNSPNDISTALEASSDSSDDSDDLTDVDEDLTFPEFRLVRHDDPEAYNFNTTQYSAHKLPKDVVDASKEGHGGLREFAEEWKDIWAKRQNADEEGGND
ncbi:MAG: hypothetical protein M1822_009172 [Bathelium mastoideum]|nr:MAG: hypothetical protein M1822_009172 [Bathelium mastoideum]